MLCQVTVRTARESDLQMVLNLESDWVKEGITYGLVPSGREDFERCLGDYFWIAEMDSQIVGSVAGRTKTRPNLAVVKSGESYAEIEYLYVVPD